MRCPPLSFEKKQDATRGDNWGAGGGTLVVILAAEAALAKSEPRAPQALRLLAAPWDEGLGSKGQLMDN